MATWDALRDANPDLAAAGERLLTPDGTGFAFLATTDHRHRPRVHPIVPVLAAGRLHTFIVTMSPKYEDLRARRDFALHASLPSGGGEEFYVTGRAIAVDDAARREAVREACGRRLGGSDFEALFELDMRHVLHTLWRGWGTPQIWPEYTRWHAG